jgi:hypothetical protein
MERATSVLMSSSGTSLSLTPKSPFFAYVIMNNGHSNPDVAERILSEAATRLAKSGADAAGKFVTTATSAAIGAAIGGLIGIGVPVIGTIVGAALGSLTGSILDGLFDMINPSCDGPLAAGTHYVTGPSAT